MRTWLRSRCCGSSRRRFVGLGLMLMLPVCPAAAGESSTPELADEAMVGDYGEVDPQVKNLVTVGHVFQGVGRYQSAMERFLGALRLEPNYWPAWSGLASAMKELDRQGEAAEAFGKAIELRDRCSQGLASPCPLSSASQDGWPETLFLAGYSFLQTGDYGLAARTLKQAHALAGDESQRKAVEWLAIARFGETDVVTAWQEYKELFQDQPFPDFNEDNLTVRQARRSRQPPAGFYRLLKAGMRNIRDSAYRSGHRYYEYFHAQNVARVEAIWAQEVRKIRQPAPFEDYRSREYLIALFVDLRFVEDSTEFPKNSNFRTLPGYRIQPALSRYALEAALRAEKAVDRKKYQKAEDFYRLALATDPWWIKGQFNLIRLEFINYGYCGPRETLDFVAELKGIGIAGMVDELDTVPPTHRDLDYWNRELTDMWDEAAESGSAKLEAWCDINSPGLSVIVPDREVVN